MDAIPSGLVELPEQPVSTDLYIAPGLFVKHCVFAAGTYIPQHSHEVAHLSVVATGAVRVWKDGALLGDHYAPSGILIEAHAKHMFLALEPFTTVLCVHAVDESGDPAVHEEHSYTEY